MSACGQRKLTAAKFAYLYVLSYCSLLAVRRKWPRILTLGQGGREGRSEFMSGIIFKAARSFYSTCEVVSEIRRLIRPPLSSVLTKRSRPFFVFPDKRFFSHSYRIYVALCRVRLNSATLVCQVCSSLRKTEDKEGRRERKRKRRFMHTCAHRKEWIDWDFLAHMVVLNQTRQRLKKASQCRRLKNASQDR